MCWQTVFSFSTHVIFFVKEATYCLLKTTPALNAILSVTDGGREDSETSGFSVCRPGLKKSAEVQTNFDICRLVCHTYCLLLKLKVSFINTRVNSLEQFLY